MGNTGPFTSEKLSKDYKNASVLPADSKGMFTLQSGMHVSVPQLVLMDSNGDAAAWTSAQAA